MALSPQMINFVRLDFFEELIERAAVREIAVMKMKLHSRLMGIDINIGDARRIKGAGAANHAMNLIVLMKKKFGQIGTVLAGNSRDKRFFKHRVRFYQKSV